MSIDIEKKNAEWHQINCWHDEQELYQGMLDIACKLRSGTNYQDAIKIIDIELDRCKKVLEIINQQIQLGTDAYESNYSELFIPHQRHIAKVLRRTEGEGNRAGNQNKFNPFA